MRGLGNPGNRLRGKYKYRTVPKSLGIGVKLYFPTYCIMD